MLEHNETHTHINTALLWSRLYYNINTIMIITLISNVLGDAIDVSKMTNLHCSLL